MGQAGVGAGDHDGIKGQARCTVLVQAVDQLRLQLQLGHAHLDAADDLGECLVGDGLGLAHQLQLPVLLDAAEAVDLGVAGNQAAVQVLLIVHELGIGQEGLFKAQLGDAEVGDGIVDALGVAHRGDVQHLEALDAVFGGLDVAGVGEIAAAVFRHDGNALGDVKLGAVLAAEAAGQQQTLSVGQQGQVFVKILHGSSSCFLQGK